MPDLPSGTVTFIFTDIEGSTAIWEQDQAAIAEGVVRHFPVIREIGARADTPSRSEAHVLTTRVTTAQTAES